MKAKLLLMLSMLFMGAGSLFADEHEVNFEVTNLADKPATIMIFGNGELISKNKAEVFESGNFSAKLDPANQYSLIVSQDGLSKKMKLNGGKLLLHDEYSIEIIGNPEYVVTLRPRGNPIKDEIDKQIDVTFTNNTDYSASYIVVSANGVKEKEEAKLGAKQWVTIEIPVKPLKTYSFIIRVVEASDRHYDYYAFFKNIKLEPDKYNRYAFTLNPTEKGMVLDVEKYKHQQPVAKAPVANLPQQFGGIPKQPITNMPQQFIGQYQEAILGHSEELEDGSMTPVEGLILGGASDESGNE